MLRPYISGCLLPTSRDAGSVVATRRHRDRGRPGGGWSAGRRVARVRLPAGGALAPARHPHPHRSRAAVGRDRPRHGGSEACWCVARGGGRSEEHTSELQSRSDLVCRLLLEKKKHNRYVKTVMGKAVKSLRAATGADNKTKTDEDVVLAAESLDCTAS